MTRVIHDYPELRNNIGNMRTIQKDKAYDAMIAENGTVGGRNKLNIGYDAESDTKGNFRADEFTYTDHACSNHFKGVSALGHGLASLLPNSGDRNQDLVAQNTGAVQNEMLEEVLDDPQFVDEDAKDQFKRQITQYSENEKKDGSRSVTTGQIDPKESGLAYYHLTTERGAQSPADLFAESFSDVYQNGVSASPLSVEMVKQYEVRQSKLTKSNFDKKKHRSWFRKFLDFFRF